MRRPGRGFGTPRPPFGGGYGFGPGLPMTPVVRNLLIANGVLFLVGMLPGVDVNQLRQVFGFVPREAVGGLHVWQFVTYMFLHGSFAHIAVNMFYLWMFGTSVEGAWGSRPFLWYYLVCGVGGAILTWITGPGSGVAMIGASAAALGVLTAFTLMYPDRQVLVWFVIPVRIKVLFWFLVAIDLLAAFNGRQDGIAHFAHLGGVLSGWLYLKQDWRLGAFGRRVRGQRARQKMERNAERTRRQEMDRDARMAEVNRILEKINREGMDALTEEELRILREASRH